MYYIHTYSGPNDVQIFKTIFFFNLRGTTFNKFEKENFFIAFLIYSYIVSGIKYLNFNRENEIIH